MKVPLRLPWELSDEHPTSAGRLVLVNQDLDEAYGADDIVECCPMFWMTAGDALERLAGQRGDLSDAERESVAVFLSGSRAR